MKFVKNDKITKDGCWVCLKINWIEKLSKPNWIERCFLKANLLIKKITVYTSLSVNCACHISPKVYRNTLPIQVLT